MTCVVPMTRIVEVILLVRVIRLFLRSDLSCWSRYSNPGWTESSGCCG